VKVPEASQRGGEVLEAEDGVAPGEIFDLQKILANFSLKPLLSQK